MEAFVMDDWNSSSDIEHNDKTLANEEEYVNALRCLLYSSDSATVVNIEYCSHCVRERYYLICYLDTCLLITSLDRKYKHLSNRHMCTPTIIYMYIC